VNRNNNRFIAAAHIRLLVVLMGLSLVWIVFAKLIVPPVIESAYRGESWPFLNRMILGQAEFPVSHYLEVGQSDHSRVGSWSWILAYRSVDQ